ncbi:MAG: glycerol-3-phosphate dehydrogenase [Myxococcota bacterium]|jgi:glycerol-3-phosphate dehydrogenase|nr:glycerol-3-phosphate dehydrogenase [Myxococcota bacterium]
MAKREQQWSKLERCFDVLIIGGGINGAGIARDAARRGLSVALLEMQDFASGTSSRSSKLIHGGLRYLEQFELSLVFESVSERHILLHLAPHLVNPLEFLLPVYRGSKHGLLSISAGMWLYEGLSLFRTPALHRRLKTKELATQEPALRRTGLTGAQVYHDCATDDARLTLETLLDAVDQGAVALNWAKVIDLGHDDKGRVERATVQDQLSKRQAEVGARVVINAAGPWVDDVLALSPQAGPAKLLRCTKGVHFVTAWSAIPVHHALVASHPADGRVFFIIPWGEQSYVGTTDTDFEGDPAKVAADADDIAYLLAGVRHFLPELELRPEQISSTWAGLRPLIAPPMETSKQVKESDVSREHKIVIGQDGLLSVAGGKLTTYRRMAKEVVDKAVDLLRLSSHDVSELRDARTDQVPLPGGRFWPVDDVSGIAVVAHERAKGHLDERGALHLASVYGTMSNALAALIAETPELGQRLQDTRPELMVQVDWAVRRELATTLCDFMIRRSQLFFRAPDQGEACASLVAQRMASLLGWSRHREAAEIKHYLEELSRSRAWKKSLEA